MVDKPVKPTTSAGDNAPCADVEATPDIGTPISFIIVPTADVEETL